MAAYPTLPITTSSQPSRLDGYVAVRATNGALKMRKLISGEKMEWTLSHELSATQKTTLEAHFQAEKLNSFAFTWPGGSTYTVCYLSAPLFVDQPGGWFTATVKLGEV